MKFLIATFIALGIVAGTTYIVVHHNNQTHAITVTNYPSKGKNVIAFGDSLIKGVGATKGNDFVSLISKDTGIPIINKGVSGNTSAQGLARIDDVLNNDPKVVLVLFGGNDILQQVPSEETFKNLGTIIEKIQQKRAIVILLGIPAGIVDDPYQKQFRALADTYNTAYVPDILSGLLGHSEYMSDEVHPNDVGYRKIANIIAPVVLKLTK